MSSEVNPHDSQFSPSTVWVSEIKLRSSDLAANVSTLSFSFFLEVFPFTNIITHPGHVTVTCPIHASGAAEWQTAWAGWPLCTLIAQDHVTLSGAVQLVFEALRQPGSLTQLNTLLICRQLHFSTLGPGNS